jgi:hypothetical protein
VIITGIRRAAGCRGRLPNSLEHPVGYRALSAAKKLVAAKPFP